MVSCATGLAEERLARPPALVHMRRMITRGDILWLGISSGVTGGLVGGLMLGIGLAMMIEHLNIGLLLIVPGAPASGLIGWLLSRRLAKQLPVE